MRQLLWPGAFGPDAAAAGAETLELPPTLAHRLRRVLRLHDGAELRLGDGDGASADVRLAGDTLRRCGPIAIAAPTLPAIWLAFAMLKGDRDDWLVEKAAEIGVDRLLPLRCEHGVSARDAGRDEARRGRWQALCDSAFEQCGRSRRARVELPRALAALPADADGAALTWIVGDETGGPALADVAAALLRARAASGGAPGVGRVDVIGLIVGPEGGLSAAERALLASRGAHSVSLGPHVLRAETAAVVGTGLLVALRSAGVPCGVGAGPTP